MIKAVFIDFDGTLYSHKTEQVPDSTVDAIKKLRQNNVKVFLCTGRSPIEMSWFNLKGIEFDGYVFNNGQLVLDKNHNPIFEIPLDGKLKEILVKLFIDHTLPIYFVNADDIYLNYIDKKVTDCQNKIDSPVPHLGEYNDETIYMCSAFVDSDSELDQYGIREYGEVTYWQEGAVDICPKNVSKVTGIKAAIDALGISFEETMGIGDGHNDIEMIQACGIGVCVGNGKDEVKNVSDYVSTDIDEDGIYNACMHYKLI